jgi:hypothetical protein
LSSGVILRWQLLGMRNATRAACAGRLWNTLLVTGAAALLVIYNVASLYASLARAAPVIRGAWPAVREGGLAACLVLGLACGYGAASWAARRAQAPWLAALPWPDGARRRAIRVAAFALGGGLMPVPAMCGWGVSHAVHAAHQDLAGLTLAVCFAGSFAAGAWPGERRSMRVRAMRAGPSAAARVAHLWRLTEKLDRSAPRWAGSWAQADGGTRLSVVWLAAMAVIGGSAAAMTFAQNTVWPSVIAGAAGGNLVYAVGLRAQVLTSPVLRASPVTFFAAWWAVARRPWALSLLWFAAAALPALMLDKAAWRQMAGGAAILLALNVLFSSTVAASPGSKQRAVVLYCTGLGMILYQGAEYGVAYGTLACLAASCLCGVLWCQARRRFRVHG